MKAFIVDLLAWVIGVAIVLSLLFWAANAKAVDADIMAPLTLETRTVMIAGVLLGIDMSLAAKNDPPMTNDQALRIATEINKGTKECQVIKCMLDKIGGAISSIRAAASQRKQFPLEGEIIR